MPTTGLIGNTQTQTTRPLSAWIGGRDVTDLVLVKSFSIEDAGSAQGSLSVTLNETPANLAEVTDQAFVRVFDETQATEMWRGFVKSRAPTLIPTRTTTAVRATDHGELLDAYIPGPVERPAGESDRARIGYIWGYHAAHYLSPDLSSVQQVSASLPAQVFQGVTLRRALDLIAAQAGTTASWYLDQTGHLHYFASETNAAPKNVTTDTPGAGEVSPTNLSIDYDSGVYANAVWVAGQNADGSGWVYDHSEIARVGTIVTASLSAPDCETGAMRDALGNMYLGRVVAGTLARGSFTVYSHDADGWRAGQTLDVRSADVGIDTTFRIARVSTSQLAPSSYRYDVEFGASGRGSSGGDSGSQGLPGGSLVYGDLGGSSNTYVTADGLRVTDGSTVRVEVGSLGADDYGLRVTNAGATVIIDGTSNMFKIVATGTLSVGIAAAGSQASANTTIDTGLTYTPLILWSLNLASTQAYPVPYYIWNLSSRLMNYSYEGRAEVVATSQTKVTATTSAGAGISDSGANTYRYYILEEVAF